MSPTAPDVLAIDDPGAGLSARATLAGWRVLLASSEAAGEVVEAP